MMKGRQRRHNDTLLDRLAIAFAAAVIAALTLILAPLVAMLATGRPPVFRLWGVLLSGVGIAFVLLCAAVGFVAGSEKTANLFAVLWGTHPVWENERFVRIVVGTVILATVIAIAFWVL